MRLTTPIKAEKNDSDAKNETSNRGKFAVDDSLAQRTLVIRPT